MITCLSHFLPKNQCAFTYQHCSCPKFFKFFYDCSGEASWLYQLILICRYLWHNKNTFAIAQHKHHRSIYEEADANKRRKRYARPLIDLHMKIYRYEGMEPWSIKKNTVGGKKNLTLLAQSYLLPPWFFSENYRILTTESHKSSQPYYRRLESLIGTIRMVLVHLIYTFERPIGCFFLTFWYLHLHFLCCWQNFT